MWLPMYNDDVTVICALLQINERLLYRMELRMELWYTDLIIVLSACLYISVYVMPLVFLYSVYGIVNQLTKVSLNQPESW